MIGVDTNVLVRYLTADDPSQLEQVDRLVEDAIAAGERLYVNGIVLCECIWVLSSHYGYAKGELVEALESIVETQQFSIAQRDLVRKAIDSYREGKGDFSDYLVGELNRAAGCRYSASFDRGLAGSDLFRIFEKA